MTRRDIWEDKDRPEVVVELPASVTYYKSWSRNKECSFSEQKLYLENAYNHLENAFIEQQKLLKLAMHALGNNGGPLIRLQLAKEIGERLGYNIPEGCPDTIPELGEE